MWKKDFAKYSFSFVEWWRWWLILFSTLLPIMVNRSLGLCLWSLFLLFVRSNLACILLLPKVVSVQMGRQKREKLFTIMELFLAEKKITKVLYLRVMIFSIKKTASCQHISRVSFPPPPFLCFHMHFYWW